MSTVFREDLHANRLAPDLAARGIASPSQDLNDDAYFTELTKVVLNPDALPERAVEDL